jgi:hypothetical protein
MLTLGRLERNAYSKRVEHTKRRSSVGAILMELHVSKQRPLTKYAQLYRSPYNTFSTCVLLLLPYR